MKAIVDHLELQLKLESTAQLRKYAEERMTTVESRYTEFEEKTEIELLDRLNHATELETRVNNHITDILNTRKRWLVEHPQENIHELFTEDSKVLESECKDTKGTDKDFLKPIAYDEARMYSLEQAQ